MEPSQEFAKVLDQLTGVQIVPNNHLPLLYLTREGIERHILAVICEGVIYMRPEKHAQLKACLDNVAAEEPVGDVLEIANLELFPEPIRVATLDWSKYEGELPKSRWFDEQEKIVPDPVAFREQYLGEFKAQ